MLYPKQKELLNIIKDRSGGYLSLRDMAEKIGVNSPNTVLHHIHQLEKKGYLRRNPKNPHDYKVLRAPIEDVMYINIYGMSECGNKGMFVEDNVIGKMPLSTKALGVSDRAFLVKVKGDSMEPMVFGNDLVLAEKAASVASGKIAVVVHCRKPKIRKVVKAGKYVILESLSDKKPPEVVEKEADFQVVGQVKNVIRFFN